MLIGAVLLTLSSCRLFDGSSSISSSFASQGNIFSSALSSNSLGVSSENSQGNAVASSPFFSETPSSSADIGKLKTMTLDSSVGSGKFTYSTGNWGTFYSSAVEFGFYRANKSSDELLSLVGYTSITGVEGLKSSFYNINPIYGIEKMDITYFTDSLDDGGFLSYGTNWTKETCEPIVPSQTPNTLEVYCRGANYFSIESDTVDLHIESVKIYYSGDYKAIWNPDLGSGDDQVRINIESYSGDLISGISSVTLPVAIQVESGSYSVTETREYTYYSYEDVDDSPDLAESAAYTLPVDVANYFIAFGTYPANYVSKNNYRTAYRIFGDQTRCVSSYDRTDGYATAIPYQGDDTGTPFYFECDIALDDTYSSSSRGVGRLVVWLYGFSSDKGASSYNSSPVAVYTDDHYATFKEYLNCGVFGPNFDAEMTKTMTCWTSPLTLTEA